MTQVLSHLWFVIREVLRVPFDILYGTKRRAYSIAAHVAAPKDVTWSVASAHQIRLEGFPPIEIDARPQPDRPGVYKGTVSFSSRALAIAYRVLEERPGEAMSLELLPAESAPECCPGDNYVCAVAVTGNETSSVLSISQQITHTKISTRLLIPLAASRNCNRIKRNAELRAGRAPDGFTDQVKNAVITGALTFASFLALFGWSEAAMLIAVILIHEFGHVIAMRWLGIPVKGIYFVPFFGGVAVGAGNYQNEGERGLVAIMGPAFSMTTTALFAVLAAQSNDGFMRNLAFMSAAVNGFNLLPIFPLDGGHVVQSLLSRFGAGVTTGFQRLGLIAGLVLALAIHSYALTIILLLIAPSVFSNQASVRPRLEPLTRLSLAALASAYIASFIFYAGVAAEIVILGARVPAS